MARKSADEGAALGAGKASHGKGFVGAWVNAPSRNGSLNLLTPGTSDGTVAPRRFRRGKFAGTPNQGAKYMWDPDRFAPRVAVTTTGAILHD